MSAAAPTIAAPRVASRSEAWRSLLKLVPYLGRYKGGLSGGLLTLIVMGVAGALPPLYIGAIIDSLSGHKEPMSQLGRLGGSLMHFLAPFYRPSDDRTLLLCCALLVGVICVKGIFLFASRWILIGISRDIEYDLRNDLLAHLLVLEPEFYVRNRTGELMSRATNDLNSVRMVLGPGIMYSATTFVTMILAIFLMVLPLAIAHALGAASGARGRHRRALFRPPDSCSLRKNPGVARHAFREACRKISPASAWCAPMGRSRPKSAASTQPNREYVARNLGLITIWSLFMPALQVLIGLTFLLVLWQGGRLVMLDRISLGDADRVLRAHDPAVFPMIALGFVTNIFQRGAASMGRLNTFSTRPRDQRHAATVPKAKAARSPRSAAKSNSAI